MIQQILPFKHLDAPTKIASIVGSPVNIKCEENLYIRKTINMIERTMKTKVPGAFVGRHTEDICPTIHHFAPDVYGREVFLPKGTIVVGKLHKFSHLNILLKGRVQVVTEDGAEEIIAPKIWTSNACIKRLVKALEDSVWLCIHPTDTEDLDKIEEQHIATGYAQLARKEV